MVDMNGKVSPEQLRYARALSVGMKAGLAVLIGSFAVYLAGALPVQARFEDLPRLWSLPVEEYLRTIALEPGWSWLASGKGDLLALTGIALLAGISIPCLLSLLPAYWRQGDRVHFATALAITVVLVLAAAGAVVPH
jgi:hypothetical protein